MHVGFAVVQAMLGGEILSCSRGAAGSSGKVLQKLIQNQKANWATLEPADLHATDHRLMRRTPSCSRRIAASWQQHAALLHFRVAEFAGGLTAAICHCRTAAAAAFDPNPKHAVRTSQMKADVPQVPT